MGQDEYGRATVSTVVRGTRSVTTDPPWLRPEPVQVPTDEDETLDHISFLGWAELRCECSQTWRVDGPSPEGALAKIEDEAIRHAIDGAHQLCASELVWKAVCLPCSWHGCADVRDDVDRLVVDHLGSRQHRVATCSVGR